MSIFFQNLQFFKEILNLSQAEFCNSIGISQNSYDNFRRGMMPTSKALLKIYNSIVLLITANENLSSIFPVCLSLSDLTNVNLSTTH